MALACDLELDTLPCCAETHKWAWFRRYCTASRVAVALDKRTPLPRPFLDEVRVTNFICRTPDPELCHVTTPFSIVGVSRWLRRSAS